MTIDHVKNTIDVYNSTATQYAVQAESHVPIPEREKFVGLISKGGVVLDLGCGSGRDCVYFETQGLEAVGTDLSEALLTIAKKVAANSEFYIQDMREIQFPDVSFDGVWACASLLHLKKVEIPAVMASLFRILKSNGILAIIVKAGDKEAYTIEPRLPGKLRFYSYFSEAEIQNFVTTSGFKLLELYTYNETERFPDGNPTDWVVCFAQKP